MIDPAKIAHYIELTEMKREAEAKAKSFIPVIAALETELIDAFAAAGVDSMHLNGRCIYIHSQLWARPKDGDRPRACEALKRAGLGEFVKEDFNVMTLSAWARELTEAGEPIPGELSEALEIKDAYSLRVVKGKERPKHATNSH